MFIEREKEKERDEAAALSCDFPLITLLLHVTNQPQLTLTNKDKGIVACHGK